ncbi:hypothetical protein BKA64DRAFT_480547 [Cadophora sp. MPI-SDFR-AT-0126]|nr:hypothetical protein BKA64DRAFT_480547 [Leotiomycetes sp. MPI-SDFR-AT-0126]
MPMAIAEFVVTFLTLLLALLLATLPATQTWLQRAFQCLVCLVRPDVGFSRRLVWDDVPPGLLHQCHIDCQHVGQQGMHGHNSTNCLEASIGETLNRAWSLVKSNPTDTKFRMRTPFPLLFAGRYIQTDVHTLKALMMLAAKVCNDCDDKPDAVAQLRVKNIGGLYTVHLNSAPSLPTSNGLTKEEMDLIIEGSQPFYRTTILTTGNLTLDFPMPNSTYSGRGAWILAVGMTTKIGPICSIYNMQRVTHEKTEAFWKGTLVMNAFKMIGRTLSQLGDFERDNLPNPRRGPNKGLWSEAARTCFRTIMSTEYSYWPWSLKKQWIEQSALFESVVGQCPCTRSCIGDAEHSANCRRNQHSKKDPASYLTKEQCEAAFEIFNHDQHFPPNLDIIRPVFPEILQTAILGLSEVEHYFSYTGQKLDLPRELADQKYVYLRQCDDEGE